MVGRAFVLFCLLSALRPAVVQAWAGRTDLSLHAGYHYGVQHSSLIGLSAGLTLSDDWALRFFGGFLAGNELGGRVAIDTVYVIDITEWVPHFGFGLAAFGTSGSRDPLGPATGIFGISFDVPLGINYLFGDWFVSAEARPGLLLTDRAEVSFSFVGVIAIGLLLQ